MKYILSAAIIFLSLKIYSQGIEKEKIGCNVAISASMFYAISPNITYKIKGNDIEFGPVFSRNNYSKQGFNLNGVGFGYNLYPNKPNKIFDLVFSIDNRLLFYKSNKIILYSDVVNSYHSVPLFDDVNTLKYELLLGQGFKAKFFSDYYIQLGFGLGLTYIKFFCEYNEIVNPQQFMFNGQLKLKLGFRN